MAILSYAQNREDVLLHRLFAESPGGFYIDVGACHPVVHSVTKLFYDRGWRGINVEPIPSLSDLLARDRERDINLRIGLSNREGTSTLYECPRSVELSTFSEERCEELRREGFELVEHATPITTLARVCEQYADRTIDFLKIDVESFEREVLEGADWSRYRPRVVVVEATRPATNIPSHEEWEDLLLAADYLFGFFDGLNRYYVRAEDRALLPVLAVPVNFFDRYELYEYHHVIEELRHALEGTRESLGRTETARGVAQAGLDEASKALMVMRQALDDSRIASQRIRAELDTTRAQLDTTRAQLDTTRAQLDAVRGQLAPFLELGPIAIRVAQGLRRMSVHSPKLAAIAKWMIRHARIRPRVLSPDG